MEYILSMQFVTFIPVSHVPQLGGGGKWQKGLDEFYQEW
jgi:hypothetical protein